MILTKSKNTLQKLLSQITIVALVFALQIGEYHPAQAAANEFIGTANGTTKTVGFDPGISMSAGDKVVLTFPENFSITASTGSNILPTTANSVSGNRVTYVLAAGYTTGTDMLIYYTGVNPTIPGQYTVHIATKNSADVVQRTGYAIMDLNNVVDVTAVINEVMIVTIPSTVINLNVDPTVNGGRDTGSTTIIAISTNSSGGYVINEHILGNLSNGSDFVTSTGSVIPADNYFGYGSGTGAGAVSMFHDTPTSTGITGNIPTNYQEHYINYDLNIDYTKPAGTYTASIIYTITPSF